MIFQNIDTKEPIYSSFFEIQYISFDITKEENRFLTENTHKIKNSELSININEDEKDGIQTMRILSKMSKFSIKVLVHNKIGTIIALIIFTDCEFLDLVNDFCDFSWNIDDIVSPNFKFTYKKSEYVDSCDLDNYIRRVKLERILKS